MKNIIMALIVGLTTLTSIAATNDAVNALRHYATDASRQSDGAKYAAAFNAGIGAIQGQAVTNASAHIAVLQEVKGKFSDSRDKNNIDAAIKALGGASSSTTPPTSGVVTGSTPPTTNHIYSFRDAVSGRMQIGEHKDGDPGTFEDGEALRYQIEVALKDKALEYASGLKAIQALYLGQTPTEADKANAIRLMPGFVVTVRNDGRVKLANLIEVQLQKINATAFVPAPAPVVITTPAPTPSEKKKITLVKAPTNHVARPMP